MRHAPLIKLPVAAAAALVAGMLASVTASASPAPAPAHAARAAHTTASDASWGAKPDCADATQLMCAEVDDYRSTFHYYVGHDEPSVLYYSNRPGSGNQMQYNLTLPSDPGPAVVPGRSWNFQLTPAIWFGMAMCDTQSYPEQVHTCAPDSNANITPSLARHPGAAYMELQFYPPGWVKQFNAQSCDPRDWCAALTIDSLSEDPVNGTELNTACQSSVLGGIEYVNFAFITRNGKPQGAPNPLQFDPAVGGNPNPAQDLFMRPGDRIGVTLHDTAHGLRTVLTDYSTRQSGFMTASAANGFGQINYAPTAGCTETPYDFHPMYATSSPQTRVPWAAHSYNIAYDEEIGHFDYCSAVDPATGNCTGTEGAPGDQEPADGDDAGCFSAAQSLLVRVSGCTGTNDPGFDGESYQRDWPDGNTYLHPGPALFTSPLTGPAYNINYTEAALEGDQPRIEAPDLGGVCNTATGAGCTIVPPADDHQPASFYPFYSITGGGHGRAAGRRPGRGGGCQWFIGNTVPGLTATDFGGVTQYGTLYGQQYLVYGGHGATTTTYDDYHQNLRGNPCPTG